MATRLRFFATYFDPEEAYIVHGLLQANGILSQMQDTETLTMQPDLRIALGGVKIFVPIAQFRTTKDLVSQTLAENRQTEDKCVNCQTQNLRTMKSPILPLLSFWFGLVPFAKHTGRKKCRSCGIKQPIEL
ncbi:MAG: hypothetical protein V3V30_07480 [Parvularculaceae bacterium]